ncbi:hypothetical protein MASR1M12_13310 [Erysipelotrichia bacterium]
MKSPAWPTVAVHDGSPVSADSRSPAFDVVFIDPPYLKGLLDPLLQYIPQCPMFSPDTLFIIERQKKDLLGLEKMPAYRLLDERVFGDTVITFFRLTTAS